MSHKGSQIAGRHHQHGGAPRGMRGRGGAWSRGGRALASFVVACASAVLISTVVPAPASAALSEDTIQSFTRAQSDHTAEGYPNYPHVEWGTPQYVLNFTTNASAGCVYPPSGDLYPGGLGEGAVAFGECLLGAGRGDPQQDENNWNTTVKLETNNSADCGLVKDLLFQRDGSTVVSLPVHDSCKSSDTIDFRIPYADSTGTPLTGTWQVSLEAKQQGKAVVLGTWDFDSDAYPPGAAAPIHPTRPGLVANAGNASAVATVTPGATVGTDYSVSTRGSEIGGCHVPESAGGSCTVTGLSNGVVYELIAIAHGQADSDPSDPVTVRPLPPPPAPPAPPVLIADDGAVVARMDKTDADYVARFFVEAQNAGGSGVGNCEINALVGGECRIGGLANGQPVTARAKAVDEFDQESLPSASSASVTPIEALPGTIRTTCSGLTCTTTGDLPSDITEVSQAARQYRQSRSTADGTCTTAVGTYRCTVTVPSFGTWVITTAGAPAPGQAPTRGATSVENLVPPGFGEVGGSIAVSCSDDDRACETTGRMPGGASGVVQRASAANELTSTDGRPQRTSACSWSSPPTYECTAGLDYGDWNLLTEAKTSSGAIVAADLRTVTINAPAFGDVPAGPGQQRGSYAFSCDPWTGNSQSCAATGRSPAGTAAVRIDAAREQTSTTPGATVKNPCWMDDGRYQCAVDLTRGQWTVTTTAYDAAKKIVARQIETVTIAPPFGDPSVGGSARVECERRSGFNSLHFKCVAEGTKINQPALYQLRANLSGSSTKVIGACRWDSTEAWQCRAFPRNARGKWRLTFQAVDKGGVLAQGAVTLKIPGPKQEWSQG